ncbi:MAG: TrkA C-terminal domain-containing protein, partial [Negativicutes bacterium]|nr:TrkA C-terminal domain-containing protein [Negativicutes bacterium]
EILTSSAAAHRKISDLSLPSNVLIVAVVRESAVITPRGGTRLLPGDLIYVLTSKKQLYCIQDVFATDEGGVCELR